MKKCHAAIFSQTLNVIAESMVLAEMAATAKSGSPFISLAITNVTVAVGDARMMSPGRYSGGGRLKNRNNKKPSAGRNRSFSIQAERIEAIRDCINSKEREAPMIKRAMGSARLLNI